VNNWNLYPPSPQSSPARGEEVFSLYPNFKFECSKLFGIMVIGTWKLFGAWELEFGISL
jgi:hypothetical protein